MFDTDAWVRRAQAGLAVMAALNLLLGCGLGSLGMLGWNEYLTSPDAMPAAFYVAWPIGLACVGWVPCVVQLVVARGLGLRSRVAWGFALFVAFFNLWSCNLPFALLVGYSLLRPEVRAGFASER